MEEIWREVPGFPGYEVSNLGQVRSFFYRLGKGWQIAESPQRTLRPSLSNKSYQGVSLRRDGKAYRYRIGRLVLLAFIGPLPNDMEMCHNDGNSSNDRLDNLRYDTHSANMQDASKHECSPGPKPKLDQEEVHTVRTKFASGKHSQMKLAREFGVSDGLIYDVLMGRRAYKGGLGPIQKPHIRLTSQQAKAIREERASGKKLDNLAKKYNVSTSMISLIASGKRHGKVTTVEI